jgi:hypothetical protein
VNVLLLYCCGMAVGEVVTRMGAAEGRDQLRGRKRSVGHGAWKKQSRG